jgi:hypothetical protein
MTAEKPKKEFGITKDGHFRRERYDTLLELENEQQQHAIELMTFGDENGNILGLYDALERAGLGWSRRRAREFQASPAFRKATAKALSDIRASLKPKALKVLSDVLDGKSAKGVVADTGEAAWANAKVKSAAAILGDDIGQSRPNAAVQVNVGLTQNVTPGYIIRQPPRRRPADEQPAIDVTPNPQDRRD